METVRTPEEIVMPTACAPLAALVFTLLAAPPRFLSPEPPPTPPPALEAMERAADYSAAHAGRALLVLKDGEPIFERYDRGWSAERPHPLASGTKSFAGVLAAAAVTDGLLTLDEPVADTIVEWKSDPRASRITVGQLLDLTSGLSPASEAFGRAGYGIRDLGRVNDLAGRIRGGAGERPPADRFAAAVGVPVTGEPGATFRYGPSHFYAWGELLSRKLAASDRVERDYWSYFAARVLAPAGLPIGKERFAPDRAGHPNLPGGAHLTAREWARFGEFVRCGAAVRTEADDGTVTWTPTVERAALERCFVGSRANPQYGLTWWLLTGADGAVANVADGGGRLRQRLRREAPAAGETAAIRDASGAPIKVAMAAGAGKQRLYLLPEQGLVVVRFAEMSPDGAGFGDVRFLRTLLGLDGPSGERDAED